MKLTRKSFIKTAGLGLGATFASPLSSHGNSSVSKVNNDITFRLGIASYSLRGYDFANALAITKRVNISSIALKSMHMPMKSSDAELSSTAMKVRDAGIDLYGAGVIYMKTAEEVENAFRYASASGIKVIIGVPGHDLLPLVEKKVKETDVKLAIHNHGPGDDVYPSPESVYEKIKDMDKRMGLCIDIGHTIRIGLDPAENIKKYADRLYDLHIKDVNVASPEGTNIEIGRGVIDIPSVLQALIDIKYEHIVAFEFEKDENDVIPGLSESVGYVHGVLDSISA